MRTSASNRIGAVMIVDPMSYFREAISKEGNIDESPSFKRAQGRPARGQTEVGSHKIVEGMRAALRSLGNTNVTRKDIAGYAGVTPALVTYYFPERDSLIKAATLPVVETLVGDVKACLIEAGSARQQLLGGINVLLECYARNAVIVELFEEQQTATPSDQIPDLLNELETVLTTFFERWFDDTGSVFDAKFMQKAMIGTCKSVASLLKTTGKSDLAEMVCSLLLGPVFDAEKAQLPNWASVANPVC